MKSSLTFVVSLWCIASLPQCMQVSDGIEVDVAYQPEAMPAQIRTDIGYRVHLERALIAVGQVELIRCDNFVLDLWRLVAPGRARAHTLDTPTSLGVPLVLDLMESAGTPVFAGTIRPPPGSYCGIRVVGLPADKDAEGLTDQNRDMMQHSVLIAGSVENEAGNGAWPVLVRIEEALPCEIRFDRPLVVEHPVVEGLSIAIDHTGWFDGIDFAQQDTNAVQQQITKNIRSSLTALRSYGQGGL